MTTLTVSPEPTHSPPRVRIDVSTDDPAKLFTELTISRDGKPIRQQPYIGGGTVVTFDYEAPFGAPVNYTAVGSIASFSVALSGSWASLAGWTTSSGAPATSAGFLTTTGPGEATVFRNDGSSAARRMTVLLNPGFGGSLQVGPVSISFNTGFVSAAYFLRSGDHTLVPWASGSAILAWDESELTFSTALGTVVIPRGDSPGGFSTLVSARVFPGGKVPPFTLLTPALEPFSNTATTILDVTDAWLIHPIYSTLSCSIDPGQHRFRDNGINVDSTTKTSLSRNSRATTHEPPGRRNPVVFTSGPRAAAAWEMVLRTRRLVDRDAVDAICDDQTPLLLRSPQGWSWDLPDGWYSVGDYSEERSRPRLDSADRLMTLPLTSVDNPVVRLAAAWNYGADLIANATYANSRAAFPTYFDRLVGP